MTLSITDTLIKSDTTAHRAVLDNYAGRDSWMVSWWHVDKFEDRALTKADAIAAMELAEIVARGRDDEPRTSNYPYLTWQRVKELAEVLGVVALKTVLYLEGLEEK